MIDPLVLDRSKSSSFYSKSIHSKQENNWKREGKHKQNGYDIKSDYILLRQSSQGINQTDYNKSNTVNHRSLCLQMHLNQCEGMCNFIIFANSCTPYVHKTQSHMVDDIKLSKFFENFEKVSAKGLDVYYISESINNLTE